MTHDGPKPERLRSVRAATVALPDDGGVAAVLSEGLRLCPHCLTAPGSAPLPRIWIDWITALHDGV